MTVTSEKPRAAARDKKGGGREHKVPGREQWDAIVIGSGLGGLACAAAFARQGYRALVLEQHDKPGGYATAFARPGGFVFDVSLHATTVDERDGVRNLIPGFPEITEVEFSLLHPTLFRGLWPEHDIRVAQRDPEAYVRQLVALFPAEADGITGLFADMRGLADDVGRLTQARGQVDMSRFPMDFPHLFRWHDKTWGAMVDARIRMVGDLAQAWVTYRARFGDPGAVEEWQGVDAFTLLQHGGQWRISAPTFGRTDAGP